MQLSFLILAGFGSLFKTALGVTGRHVSQTGELNWYEALIIFGFIIYVIAICVIWVYNKF